jgi:ribosomal RNA-processing protein 9
VSSQSSKKGKARAFPLSEDVKGHSDEVLTLALSGDGRYLASAGRDRRICVWDTKTNEWLKGLSGHKDSITVRIT